jgi:tRNA threonylcarbamoyladenosine biosynthesis protein TsaE
MATNFSKLISPNSIIYLNGNVGSGKTYFTKKLAMQFGVYDVSSSSYERISIHKKQVNFIHCDLYRDKKNSNLLCDLDHHLFDPWIVVIEWPKQFLPIKNSNHYIVNILHISKNNRTIQIKKLANC